jgi:hypothetical protein
LFKFADDDKTINANALSIMFAACSIPSNVVSATTGVPPSSQQQQQTVNSIPTLVFSALATVDSIATGNSTLDALYRRKSFEKRLFFGKKKNVFTDFALLFVCADRQRLIFAKIMISTITTASTVDSSGLSLNALLQSSNNDLGAGSNEFDFCMSTLVWTLFRYQGQTVGKQLPVTSDNKSAKDHSNVKSGTKEETSDPMATDGSPKDNSGSSTSSQATIGHATAANGAQALETETVTNNEEDVDLSLDSMWVISFLLSQPLRVSATQLKHSFLQ